MKERPIIFSTDMVKAILEGRKTQTRRVIKPQPDRVINGVPFEYLGHKYHDASDRAIRCPYGQVGDRLWVRETWATQKSIDRFSPSYIGNAATVPLWYKADAVNGRSFIGLGKWRPSIFMPRWASRITLEITEVRVERLQEITFEDFKKEGIEMDGSWDGSFARLWDSLNAKRGYSWESNPWVWVISFRRL